MLCSSFDFLFLFVVKQEQILPKISFCVPGKVWNNMNYAAFQFWVSIPTFFFAWKSFLIVFVSEKQTSFPKQAQS